MSDDLSGDMLAPSWPNLVFNLSSAYCFTDETVETTTDQRNSSIVGRDKIYISLKKREEMQFIYLFDESR